MNVIDVMKTDGTYENPMTDVSEVVDTLSHRMEMFSLRSDFGGVVVEIMDRLEELEEKEHPTKKEKKEVNFIKRLLNGSVRKWEVNKVRTYWDEMCLKTANGLNVLSKRDYKCQV